jgi:hypothetical protein
MKNNYKLAEYTPVHITGESIDFILRELGSDALALYVAYAGISQWQKTTTIKATTAFMAERMRWTDKRVRKNKKLLLDNGYIEDVQKKQNNKIVGWYLKIIYLVSISHTVVNRTGWETSQGGKEGGQVLYKETKSALKENLSALKRNRSTSENKFSQEIVDIMELFSQINPSIQYGNKTQRKACEDMLKRFGYESTIKMVKQVLGVQGNKYAPTATTPYTMYQKLADFKVYFDKQKTNDIVLDLTKEL